jgi:nicotinate-nucleotide adenylyltransferase
MTRLAVRGVAYFEADNREVLRDGWTYTVDTVGALPAADEVVLVVGADAAAGIRTWHRWPDLLARVTLAVAPRPGTDRRVVEAGVGEPLVWLDMPEVEVSGTEIRARASQGRAFRFLVREGVWDYIQRHRLYPPEHKQGPAV